MKNPVKSPLSVSYIFLLLSMMLFIGCGKDCPNLIIGDQFEGGIIFSLDGCEGLIVSNGNIYNTFSESEQMNWTNARLACATYESDGYTDWYLPSMDELKLIRDNLSTQLSFSDGAYWSSDDFNTHLTPNNKLAYEFEFGIRRYHLVATPNYVLAVRRFEVED